MIYLDYNSTAPYSPSVLEFIHGQFIEMWQNPSASYETAGALNKLIEDARKYISQCLGCNANSLVFTSGATESINSVLSVRYLRKIGIKHIVTSCLEHKATLDSVKYLEEEGFVIHWIQNDSNGRLDLEEISQKSAELENALFTFLMANNEIGTIQPIHEIAKIVHEKKHLLHVDCVQALGKSQIDLNLLDVDYASFSGHKIGSLKGVGFLYVKKISNFLPLICGGGQERGYRAGTLNFAGIKSLELALKDSLQWDLNNIKKLRDYLENNLVATGKVFINAFEAIRICNTSSIGLKGFNSRDVFKKLEDNEIYPSLGSACNSHCMEPSHVISALGLRYEDAISCLRFSIGNKTTKDEIDKVLDVLKPILEK